MTAEVGSNKALSSYFHHVPVRPAGTRLASCFLFDRERAKVQGTRPPKKTLEYNTAKQACNKTRHWVLRCNFLMKNQYINTDRDKDDIKAPN